MEKLNEFLNDNKENLQIFYKNLMLDTKPEETIDIPNQVKQNSLASLHILATRYTNEQIPKLQPIVKELEAQIPNEHSQKI